ncbi:MAG: hypothetical protein HY040_11540 [Planctomycetes bacterium]|nr:hypothetical protein [Planctomycetota bacterium]
MAHIADWVYGRCANADFDTRGFGRGQGGSQPNLGDIHQQVGLVYRDNLVHFIWFLNLLMRKGIDPLAYFIRARRLLPTYHSSGLYAILAITGCASMEDAERLAAGAEARICHEDVETASAERDISELRGLHPERADPITMGAVQGLLRVVRTLYAHVPDGAEAIERVFFQTSGEVSLYDRGVLRQVLKGKLVCLSGFGPRPYVREDVDRLMRYCLERGIHVELSVINGPDLHIIGGSALDVARAEVVARKGLAGRIPFLVGRVLVDGAPHLGRYREGVRRYEAVVDRFIQEGRLRKPVIPFVSRYGAVVKTLDDVRREVLHLMDEPFDFQAVCKTAIGMGARWVVIGLSGERSAGRRVVRANLMDAAVAERSRDLRFASTDASTARSLKDQQALVESLFQDASALGLRGMKPAGVKRLEALWSLWESALAVQHGGKTSLELPQLAVSS